MPETAIRPDIEERPSRGDVYERLDRATVIARREDRESLRAILDCDRYDLWKGNGARSHAEFLAGRLNISQFKARRRIAAAYALEHLPRTAHALESGLLGLDTVVELTRFATPKTEARLIKWARKVTPGAVTRRADEETRVSKARFEDARTARDLDYWGSLDGTELHFEGRVPTAEGEKFVKAIDRLLPDVTPCFPEGDTDFPETPTLGQRRADALILLCSAQIANDQDPDRATIVVNAPAEIVMNVKTDKNATVESGGVLDARTVQRMACEGRIEVVSYTKDGKKIGIGRASRVPPRWLRRMVLRRHSGTCAFPGCEKRRFLDCHHIKWWEWDGETNYDNLIPLCDFHHDLIHDHKWSVILEGDEAVWFRPSGRRYEPGPAPPSERKEQSVEPVPPLSENDAPWPAFHHLLQTEDLELTRGPGMGTFLKMMVKMQARRPVPRVPA